MTELEAMTLIEDLYLPDNQSQKWADLGCGNGLFTYALASLLSKNSRIMAIDKVDQAPIKSIHQEVNIKFHQCDFIYEEIPENGYDGFLMANSFHYVKDKQALIQKIRKKFRSNGRVVLVEYDTKRSNPWVPFPIPFKELSAIFGDVGIRKIGERPSRFGYKNMYAAEIQFHAD